MNDAKHGQQNNNLTTAEVSMLWTAYMLESMVHHMVTCFFKHVEDTDIKGENQNWINRSKEFLEHIKSFFEKENLPVPRGITSEDINLDAPRLFTDKYVIFFGEYMSNFAVSLNSIAYTQCSRPDMKDFMKNYVEALILINQKATEISIAKGFHIKPPFVPLRKDVEFVESKAFLAGFFNEKRPLTVREITQLYLNASDNSIGIATMTAYSQVAKSVEVKQHFLKGKSLAAKLYGDFCHKLDEDNIPIPSQQTGLVTDSTESPFSDRLMLFNDTFLSSIGLGNYGMAIAGSSRHDLSALFGKAVIETGAYVEGGTKLMINNGWMEQPPTITSHKAMALV